MEVFETIARVLMVLGLIAGAYQSYKQMRAAGTWHTRVAVIMFFLGLLYAVVGTALLVAFAVWLSPAYLVPFLVFIVIYYVAGLAWLVKTGNRLKKRAEGK